MFIQHLERRGADSSLVSQQREGRGRVEEWNGLTASEPIVKLCIKHCCCQYCLYITNRINIQKILLLDSFCS